jgi:hypothetical protein
MDEEGDGLAEFAAQVALDQTGVTDASEEDVVVVRHDGTPALRWRAGRAARGVAGVPTARLPPGFIEDDQSSARELPSVL